MASRETGALKKAKDKLEKKVEELTWRLQLEKRLRIDLEEEKAKEIAKVHDALPGMQLQLEEANARVIKEKKAARKAIEEASPVIKETPILVQDMEKVDALTAEVESLKALLQSEKHVVEEAGKACTVVEAKSAELAKQLEDTERKAEQLQESVQRLEEKISYSESEIQVLRQQALSMSPTGKSMSMRPKTMIVQRTLENGNVVNGEVRGASVRGHDTTLALSNPREPESEVEIGVAVDIEVAVAIRVPVASTGERRRALVKENGTGTGHGGKKMGLEGRIWM